MVSTTSPPSTSLWLSPTFHFLLSQSSEVKPDVRSSSPRGTGEAPPGLDFDTHPKGSDLDDNASGGKPRGGGSLGTKSASTSLLSMLSASPRSLSTAQDSVTNSPRTPLSDQSSETRRDSAGSNGSDGVANRAGSAPITCVGDDNGRDVSVCSVTEDGRRSAPVATTAAAAAAAGGAAIHRFDVPAVVIDMDDDDDVPSAHPTPLYSLDNNDDDDLPSDHPTPLSTAGGRSRRRNFSEQRCQPSSVTQVTQRSLTQSREKRISGSSSFMDKLKYWGGSGGGSVSGSSSNGGGVKKANVTATSAGRQQRKQDTASVFSEAPPDISSAERCGMPVAPVADSFEETLPAHFSATAAVHQPTCGVRSNPKKEGETKRVPSPSPGRHRGRQQLHVVAGESLPDVDPQHGRPEFDMVADSVFLASNLSSSASRSGGGGGDLVVEIPAPAPGSSGRSEGPLTGDSSTRRSPFVETVQHEDELINKAFQETEDRLGGEEFDEEESDMDWDANSDEGKAEKKLPLPPPATGTTSIMPPPPPPQQRQQQQQVSKAKQRHDEPPMVSTGRADLAAGGQPLPAVARAAPPAPRYMAIVDAASGNSALDSSTSEHDTSPSEDDGGMMAEILTDRLMEVASKMEASAPQPAEELSDGEGQGDASGRRAMAAPRRRMSTRSFGKDVVS